MRWGWTFLSRRTPITWGRERFGKPCNGLARTGSPPSSTHPSPGIHRDTHTLAPAILCSPLHPQRDTQHLAQGLPRQATQPAAGAAAGGAARGPAGPHLPGGTAGGGGEDSKGWVVGCRYQPKLNRTQRKLASGCGLESGDCRWGEAGVVGLKHRGGMGDDRGLRDRASAGQAAAAVVAMAVKGLHGKSLSGYRGWRVGGMERR